MTPGGALKVGETYERAARRELWEETGLREVELRPCVWTVRFSFVHEGTVYDQRERYYVVRVDLLDVNRDNWEAAERVEIQAQRWWTVEEIAASDADFRPAELARLLPAIVAGSYPEAPLSASVEGNASVVDLAPT